MSIRASCPVCEATATLADSMRGKQIECKSCGELFRAEDEEAAEAIQSAPRKAAPPARRRVVDEDDDEPRGRARPRRDDDDEDDDRPRRGRPRPDEGSSGLLIGLLVGGGVLLVAVVGLVLFFLLRSTPNAAAPPVAAVDAKPGAAPAPEMIQLAEPPVRLHVKDTEIRDIITNGPANTRAVVHSWEIAGKTKHLFDVYDIPKAARLTRLELAEPQQMDLSPDGTRLAIFTQSVENGQLLRRVGVWSLPDGKPLVENWTPYPNDADFAKQRELIWVYLLSADRMLTISRQGQFDVWDLGTQKNVASVPPLANGLSLSTNLFGRTALSFAVSPNRKMLAVYDKTGYSVFDTTTGKTIVKTTPLADEGTATNLWGVAFSPDGNTLASYYYIFKNNEQTGALTRWSLPDGKRLSQQALPKDAKLSGGLAFWGPGDVLLWSGNIIDAKVYPVHKGAFPRHCLLRNQGKCVAQPQDGRLWYATAQTLGGIAELTCVDLPRHDLPAQPNDARHWVLTPGGITP